MSQHGLNLNFNATEISLAMRTKFILDIQNPLQTKAKGALKIQHGFLISSHITLALNWLLPFAQTPPLPGLLLSSILVVTLYLRGTSCIKEYVSVLKNRLLLSYTASIALIIYTNIYYDDLFYTSSIEWYISGIILASLSAYDTVECMRGRKGLHFAAPIKNKMSQKRPLFK